MSDQDNKSNNGQSAASMILGVLDRLFTPETSFIGRVFGLIVIFALVFIWYKGEHLAEVYRQSRFEEYAKILAETQKTNFDKVMIEQLQIAHTSSGADFTAVYVYKPTSINNFYDVAGYEGELPEGVNSRELNGIPIDKTSDEYKQLQHGMSYSSSTTFNFIPLSGSRYMSKQSNVHFVYSCPIFNMDNVYSGMFTMMWFTVQENPNKERLNAICAQASRALGRAQY